MSDDEELCPVCESTCTCNHQPRDRGSARANGYMPKGVIPAGRGKGQHSFGIPSQRSASPAPSKHERASSFASSSASPLKIRLVLGQRKQSLDADTVPSRRKRSIEYTSSSEATSSDASVKGKAKATGVASGISSSSSAFNKSRAPSISAMRSQVGPTRPTHPTTSRPPAPSIPRPKAIPSSSKGAGPSKPGPSSAWFLGAPPPKTTKFNALRKPLPSMPKERVAVAPIPAPVRLPSHAHAGQPKTVVHQRPSSSTVVPPKQGKGPLAYQQPVVKKNNKSRVKSPKKRRRIDYTPSPSQSSESDFSEGDFVPSRSRLPKPTPSVKASGSSSGVTLGRPVGVVLPTFVPKPTVFSDSSQSDTDNGTDDEGDVDMDDPDDEIQREEERMLLDEARKRDKAKRKKHGGGHQNHRKLEKESDVFGGSDLTSLSSGHSSSRSASSSSSSSSSSEEEEDPDEEDDENDEMDGAEADDDEQMEPVWSHSEDGTDADLFFANFLSESSASSSSDEAEAAVSRAVKDDSDMEADSTHPMVDFGFGINEGEVFVDAEVLKRRRRPARTQPLIVTNNDGHLVLAEAWDGGKGLVDSEWEKTQLSIMMNDEDVTSEESEPEGDPQLRDDNPNVTRQSTESTETDFEGETTVDEGLDEDGLPPNMASQSQQHKAEREFNMRRLGLDVPMPLPDNLPPGVQVFQGGYSTVMFGRFDFPSTQPPGEANEYTDVWEGIKDDPIPSPSNDSAVKEEAIDVNVLMSPVTHMTSSVRDMLSLASSVSVEPELSAAIDPQASKEASSVLLPPIAGLGFDHVESPDEMSEDHPLPPRKLPVMGSFRMSPPRAGGNAGFGSSGSSTNPSSESALISSLSSLDAPAVTPRKGMAIIDGRSHVMIPSPFAGLKRRKKPGKHRRSTMTEESDGSLSMSQRGDWHFGQDFSIMAGGRGRRPLPSHSARSSFSQSLPPPAPNLLVSPPMPQIEAPQTPGLILPATPGFGFPFNVSAPMDLADVLDSAFLDESDDAAPGAGHVDEGEITDKAALRNLTRWERVPMGTFRHSRAFSTMSRNEVEVVAQQPQSSPLRTSDGFSYGAISRPSASLQTALWSEGADVKGKGKAVDHGHNGKKRKRQKLVVSPTLLPIRDEDLAAKEVEEKENDLMTGVEEEEGYFSKRHHKGGREGTERERIKRKFEDKDRKSSATARVSPIHKRVKHGGNGTPLVDAAPPS